MVYVQKQCECKAKNCNPCTNIVRILNICPECCILGHAGKFNQVVINTIDIIADQP